MIPNAFATPHRSLCQPTPANAWPSMLRQGTASSRTSIRCACSRKQEREHVQRCHNLRSFMKNAQPANPTTVKPAKPVKHEEPTLPRRFGDTESELNDCRSEINEDAPLPAFEAPLNIQVRDNCGKHYPTSYAPLDLPESVDHPWTGDKPTGASNETDSPDMYDPNNRNRGNDERAR